MVSIFTAAANTLYIATGLLKVLLPDTNYLILIYLLFFIMIPLNFIQA